MLTTSICLALNPAPAAASQSFQYLEVNSVSSASKGQMYILAAVRYISEPNEIICSAHQGVEAAVSRKVSIEVVGPLCAGEPQLFAACSLEVHGPWAGCGG